MVSAPFWKTSEWDAAYSMRLADALAYLVPEHPAVERLGPIGELARIRRAQLQRLQPFHLSHDCG